jgi:DNA-binding transcriptional LysR family regulator
MVATRPGHGGAGEADYVHVDWGPDFDAWHSGQFPRYSAAGLHVSLGALGLKHILTHGGAGYFPARVVADELARKKLFPVKNAPEFVRPAHVIYAHESASAVRAAALESLRAAVAVDGAGR